MLTLIFQRARPPRNKVLKNLFGKLVTNFWYSIEEDVYLDASALGVPVVTMKCRVGWHAIHWN